ncbi:unnamed protein product [Adineta ricciae]|uniref:TIR domain-containing protein n=1 Tax=Adineta ricciae TaxID=249248 RepID=A0A816EPD9_ADIRI|nr:unnamed protein product [Adineta ricciae]
MFIDQLVRELQAQNRKWRILLLFNQNNLYSIFHRVLHKLQTDQDGDAQLSCPVSCKFMFTTVHNVLISLFHLIVIQIKLNTTSDRDLLKCEHEINDYVWKNIVTNRTVTVSQWNQPMFNAFCSYCLTKSVLPEISDDLQLNLTGSILDVEKAITKYQLMNDISKELPLTMHNDTSSVGYNIYFSYSRSDQSFCKQLVAFLSNEGYSISRKSSKKPLSASEIEKSDVFLIGFTEEYSKNSQCMDEFNHAKALGKTLIPFVIRQSISDSDWLCSIATATLFYDLFDREIDLEFTDDFDLEYDKLLIALLRYTKPGSVGRPYVLPSIAKKEEDQEKEYQEVIFGNKSSALQKLTPNEIQHLQANYQKELKEKIAMNRIPADEIDPLVASLMEIVDDLQSVLRGDDPYINEVQDHQHTYSSPHRSWELDKNCQGVIYEFMCCAKRWLARAPNVSKKQFAPFTPTRDLNDAVFCVYQSPDSEKYQRTYETLDHSPSEKKSIGISIADPGSSFNDEQMHDYFAKLVKKYRPGGDVETEIKENEIAWRWKKPTETDDKLYIGNELKTPEEIRQIEERDNPRRVWKKTRGAKEFIQQKIRNILELQKLCEQSK